MSIDATRAKSWLASILLAFVALAPSWAAADGPRRPFDQIVAFGDSLSDPGNAFALTGQHLTPPTYGMTTPEDLLTLIPDAPYARGGDHFSNGPTWIEDLARPIGLAASAGPAFAPGHPNASNYAVGGARARPVGDFHLAVQVSEFLGDVRGHAPADALYVIALGGNDVRDALAALARDPTFATSLGILNAALTAIRDNLLTLRAAGASSFFVVNAPDVGLAPAVRLLGPAARGAATFLAAQFNAGLEAILQGLESGSGLNIVRFDVFQALNEVVAAPEAFGLTNVTQPCIAVDTNAQPFCANPGTFLFWDGIHPTVAGHRILAKRARAALNATP